MKSLTDLNIDGCLEYKSDVTCRYANYALLASVTSLDINNRAWY